MRVALVGDSIRRAYQPLVAQALGEQAEVFGSGENGGDSANVLAKLDKMALAYRPDIIHFNCGLHDIKTPAAGGAHRTAMAEHANDRFAHVRRPQSDRACAVKHIGTGPGGVPPSGGGANRCSARDG